MNTLRDKVIKLAKEKPELRKHLVPVLKKAGTLDLDRIQSFIKRMKTPTGGRISRVEYDDKYKSWTANPYDRQRLDHYGNDGEGWDEEAWWDEYAGPLTDETTRLLEQEFGKDMFEVDVGEKGHLHIDLSQKAKALL
jgi:hypothetical protein